MYGPGRNEIYWRYRLCVVITVLVAATAGGSSSWFCSSAAAATAMASPRATTAAATTTAAAAKQKRASHPGRPIYSPPAKVAGGLARILAFHKATFVLYSA